MGRSVRQYTILAKTESVYGSDAAPVAGTDALLVSNINMVPIEASNVPRNLLRSFYGASEELLGTIIKRLSYETELAGSGAAGTAPPWGKLLQAAGFAETLTASTRADYLPVSSGFNSLTEYCNVAGVQHKLLGARHDWSLSLKVNEKPMFTWQVTGLDGAESAVVNPTPTLAAWQTPQIPTDAFTPNLKLGGTVSPTGAPAITGGTDVKSNGITLQGGNVINAKNIINLQEVELLDREITGHIDMDLTAAEEITRLAAVRANTLGSLAIEHGTVAGNKVMIYLPSVQFVRPTYVDLNQSLMNGFDFRCVPVSGNDEIRFIVY